MGAGTAANDGFAANSRTAASAAGALTSLRGGDRLSARRLPGAEPALDRRRLRVPLPDQDLRRTGARAFAPSGAVGGDELVLGQLGQVAVELAQRDAQGAHR